jgi:hypothetical protein
MNTYRLGVPQPTFRTSLPLSSGGQALLFRQLRLPVGVIPEHLAFITYPL